MCKQYYVKYYSFSLDSIDLDQMTLVRKTWNVYCKYVFTYTNFPTQVVQKV